MLLRYGVLLGILFFYKCSAICVKPDLRPIYHLAPPQGWMNDPNGFCYFNGYFHLFYQYNPFSSYEPGIANWGHANSKNLFEWQDLPIALKPDEPYDKTGVFSGSALIQNGTMYLYYTGNVNHPGEKPDHEQHQALATSPDGVNFIKYEHNPIIIGADRQPDFRDPKVWKHGSKYYMVLGNSFANETLGRVLLYESTDMINWKEVSILQESDGFLGYMSECPDFFELNGYFVLLFSPQGMKPQGDKYRNLYQVGYIVGKFDYETNKFTHLTKFVELDHGHDFYATQTILDPKGRRLMVAWFDMWEQGYPEKDDGWTGQMTLPRVLTLNRHLKLIQKPVEEVKDVLGDKVFSGRANGNTKIKLDDNAARVTVKTSGMRDFELRLEADGVNGTVTFSYDHRKGLVTLHRNGKDGIRRTKCSPLFGKLNWEIYVDSSSVELFCSKGEATFSSRIFPESHLILHVPEKYSAEELNVTKMRRTVALPEPCTE